MNTIETLAYNTSVWQGAAISTFWPGLQAPEQCALAATALMHAHPQQAAQVHRPLDMATVLDLLYG